jgi:predicted metal-binding membrane protein
VTAPRTSRETGLERVLRRDRAIVLVCLAALVLVAWLYLARLAGDMTRGDMRLMGMPSAAAAMETQAWGPATFGLVLAMWSVMMVGMMIPSAAPAILIFARAQRQQLAGESPVLPSLLFTLGYLLAWLAFSAVATTLQWVLAEAALLTPMMTSTSSVFGAVLFGSAGLYQLTPLKRACLTHCKSPLHFFAEHWRTGNSGALRMGVSHGTYCIGCCWFFMALLFVGGVMNLLWVATIAAFVLLEKVLPHGEWVTRASGVVMMAVAVSMILVAG